jgi:hypothetical protein
VTPIKPAPEPKQQAYAHYVDESGKDINVIPIAGNSDQFIRVGKKPGGSPEDPTTKYHLGVLDDYRTAQIKAAQTGVQLSPDLEDAAAESAKALGLPVTWKEDVVQPGFWSKLFGGKSTTVRSPTIGYTPQTGKIKVISPDGTEGYIPAANLQKALKRGYKQDQ